MAVDVGIDQMDENFWRQPEDPVGAEPAARTGPPAEGAPSAAAYEQMQRWPDETPEQKAERLERNRRGLALVKSQIAALNDRFTMPGSTGERPRGPVPHVEDPGQADRVRRQMDELRRTGQYDGPKAA